MMHGSFKDYRQWADPYVEMTLRGQREQFSDVFDPLHAVGLVHSFLSDERQDPAPAEPRALYAIGAQATQLAIGIEQSLAKGAAVPAAGNFRTLFELLLSVKLIRHADSQTRSDLFMDFDKVLKWDHLQKQGAAGLKPDVGVDPATVEADYQSVKDRYSSNATYWWSSILWATPKDAQERASRGPTRVCAYLDQAGVPSGVAGDTTFSELDVRWHATFSALAHATVLGANAMIVKGRRALAWQIDAKLLRIAPLALAACAEIIPACEEGLNHPKAGWARAYLGDLREAAIKAQLEHERQGH